MAPSIRLDGWPAHTDVAPGMRQRLGLSITNSSQIVDQYVLTITGLDEEWYSLTPPSVSLFPGASGAAELILHPPAGVGAGDYPFSVIATSASNPAFSTVRESGLRIGKVGAAAMELRPLRAEGRRAAFTVKWKNPTNSPLSVQLAVRDAEDGLLTFINPEGPVPVPAGQERSVVVTVWPKHGETVGPPHPYELEFRGMRPGSEDLLEPALKRSGQYIYTPPIRALALPGWLRRLPIWALLALLFFLLALLFLAGRGAGHVVAGSDPATGTATAASSPTTPPPTQMPSPSPTLVPPPTVESFGIQVGPKGNAELAWRITGATRVELAGHTVGLTGQESISVTAPRTLVLSASNGTSTVARFLRVVPPPLKILSIPSPPQRLGYPEIRQFSLHVDPRTGAATLLWQISGADTRLLNKRVVAPKGSETLTTSGPRNFVLQAMNAAGTTTSVLSLPADPRAQSRTAILHLPSIPLFTLRHLRNGQPYTLVWRITNAGSARLNGVAVPLSGSQILHAPLVTSRYLLVARNANGQVSSSVRIVVS